MTGVLVSVSGLILTLLFPSIPGNYFPVPGLLMLKGFPSLLVIHSLKPLILLPVMLHP